MFLFYYLIMFCKCPAKRQFQRIYANLICFPPRVSYNNDKYDEHIFIQTHHVFKAFKVFLLSIFIFILYDDIVEIPVKIAFEVNKKIILNIMDNDVAWICITHSHHILL